MDEENINLEEKNEKNENKPKKIKIVEGNSKDLNISPVQDNLIFEVTEDKKIDKKNIVIPQNQKD